MNNLGNMLWIELRKAMRSRMPLWTSLGSLLMPLGIAFLIFVARNPEISKKIGLISAKADLMAYSATDWPTYLTFFGQLIAAAGFIFFVFNISWVFGREFADGTVTDLLAVPVPRASILLAKFILVIVWSMLQSMLIVGVGLLMGILIQVPGGSNAIVLEGIRSLSISAIMAIIVVLPFAWMASLGRGYLLPVGAAILTMMMTNLVAIAGWGEYFPWAIPGLYSQTSTPLPAASFWIVPLTGLAGMLVTYAWWQRADQA